MTITRMDKKVKKQKIEQEKTSTEEKPDTKTAVEPVNAVGIELVKDDSKEDIANVAEEKKRRRCPKRNMLDGPLYTIRLKGDDLELFQKRYNELNKKCLVVKGKFAELKKQEDLFSDAVSVKKRAYCWVLEYKSKEAALKKLNILKEKLTHVKYLGNKLNGLCRVYAYQLALENIPTAAKKQDLKKAFPRASEIKFSEGNSTAQLIFKRKKFATEVFRKGNVLIQDSECCPMYVLKKQNVKLAKPPQKKLAKKTRRKVRRKKNVE